VVVGGDQRMHVGIGAVLRGVAVQHGVAQRVDAGGQVDAVARGCMRGQRVEQRLEHRQVGGGADVAGVGREVEHHHRDLALRALAAAQRHQAADAPGQRGGALGAGRHVGARKAPSSWRHRRRSAARSPGR
jgi:hypothetical protein